jgi:hypothetical protein
MISEVQNGFRENKSTNIATQKLLVMGILFDLTKAFDVMNHKPLLPKLELYGL